MKVKTSELIGPALDWAVAKCEEARGMKFGKGFYGEILLLDEQEFGHKLSYSTNWAQGGPIIEREELGFAKYGPNKTWKAVIGATPRGTPGYGPTPLIAAMRCYVASKLGDEVNIPEDVPC